MPDTVIDSQVLLTSAEVDVQAAGETRTPRVSVLAYTGGVMTVRGFGPLVVDLAGLEIPAAGVPILADHANKLNGILGQGDATIQSGQLLVSGSIPPVTKAARTIIDLARSGFTFKASIGARVVDSERIKPRQTIHVNGRSVVSGRAPLLLVRKARLQEISIVAIGADSNTSVDIAASQNRRGVQMTFDQWLESHDYDPATLAAKHEGHLRAAYEAESEPTPRSRGSIWPFSRSRQSTHPDPAETIRVDALAETERVAGIRDVCRSTRGDYDRIESQAIDEGWDLRQTKSAVRESLQASRPTPPTITAGHHSPPAQVIEGAILAHMGYEPLGEKTLGERTMQQARDLRATSMTDIVRAAMAAEGNDNWRSQADLFATGFTTLSLPAALGNVANKLAVESYTESPATWRAFCANKPAKDFKEHTGIRLSHTGPYAPIGKDGEIEHGGIQEHTFPFRVDTIAKILRITRQDLVNDDLSLFNDTAEALGRGAARTVADTVFGVLFANAGDFFSPARGNALTAALTLDSLGSAITAMRTQRDDESNDLDIRPATLLVAPELEETAKQVLESEALQHLIDPDATGGGVRTLPTGNARRNAVKLEVEPRISNTKKFSTGTSADHWWLFAGPRDAAVIAAFLNGREYPTLDFFGLTTEPDTLGVTWRGYLDVGAALGDFRAAVRSDGTA